jgi:dephospho-CoA kinase
MNNKGNIMMCLTGMPGSGKTTVADMLKEKGFTMVEHSSQIKRLMRIGGMKVNAKNMELFVIQLKKAFGRDVVSKLSSKTIASSRGNVVISGPRDPAEISYIRKFHPEVVVVAISAPRKLRYNRIMHRKKGLKAGNYREFEWRDRKNIALGTMKLINHADYVLVNTGTLTQLRFNLDELLRTLQDGKFERV